MRGGAGRDLWHGRGGGADDAGRGLRLKLGQVLRRGGNGAIECREILPDQVDPGAHTILQGEGDTDFVGFEHGAGPLNEG